jgi:diguanylate cyclase (GGDEF)-like protein
VTDSRARPSSQDGALATVRDRSRRLGPRGWALWSLPRGPLAYILVIELAAVAVIVSALTLGTADHGWTVAGLLFLGAVTHAEAARHIERIRISKVDRPFIDLKSMWTFAALLLTPTGPTLVLVCGTFAYWWVRNGRHHSAPHKWIFSWATVVLGTAAAGLLLPGVEIGTLLPTAAGPLGLVLIAAAAIVRWTVNHGLVVGILLLTSKERSLRRHLSSPADTLLGLGALALGAALAVLAAASPWLVPILLVPVIMLHRGVLVDQFRHAARTDPKTGLANGAAWSEVAAKEIARAARQDVGLAVLMVDLDEFKAVNDRHGHLVGDEVLRAVAASLSAEVRAYDAVGRFGGEEFVVLLSGVDPAAATVTAERLRSRIGDIDVQVPTPIGTLARVQGLTASIGCATCSAGSRSVDELLAAADAALYRAKRAGRNRTVAADPA